MTGFSAVCPLQNGLLVHGGIRKPNSTSPESNLLWVEILNGQGSEKIIDTKGKQLQLSRHAGVIIKDGSILVLVGGWTGRKRSNEIFVFDLHHQQWIDMAENMQGKGRVAPPIGLSGHTVTAVSDNLICVYGREGGIKIQRRFGDLFLLHLNLERRQFWYSEAPLKPSSRSGHCAILLPNIRGTASSVGLFVFGGRDSGGVEMCGQWPVSSSASNEAQISFKNNAPLREKILLWCRRVPEIEVMIGLRYHAMVAVAPDCIIVHGGEHFKSKPPTNISGFLFACVTGSRWFEIPCKDPVIRFGHSMVIVDGDIFVYGGFRSCQDKSAGKLEKIVIEDLPAL